MFSSRFSIFGGGGSEKLANTRSNDSSIDGVVRKEPILKLRTDKEVYRPGDSVLVTIEVVNPSDGGASTSSSSFRTYSLLIERLGFEIKGIEKLDPQWFATSKPLPGSKQRRGEYVFMEFSASSLLSNQIVSCRAAKTYVMRMMLPGIIPPSYRGSTIRYLYYIKCNLSGRWLIMENGISRGELAQEIIDLEIRSPLQIWVTQKSNGLLMEEGQGDGIVPATTVQLDVFWKDMDGEEWVRANDVEDGAEEGSESSRDEVSSVSSYNPTKDTIHKTFGSSLSLLSTAARSSNKDGPFADGRLASLSAVSLPRLSIAEVLYDSRMDSSAPDKSSVIDSPSQEQKNVKLRTEDELAAAVGAGTSEPAA